MASGGKEASHAARSWIAGCCFPAVLAAASETGGLPSPAEAAPSCRVLVQRLVQRFPRRAATRLFAERNGASHQIWARCQLPYFWWLAPFPSRHMVDQGIPAPGESDEKGEPSDAADSR